MDSQELIEKVNKINDLLPNTENFFVGNQHEPNTRINDYFLIQSSRKEYKRIVEGLDFQQMDSYLDGMLKILEYICPEYRIKAII
jgi:hypothetical protein